MKRDKQTCFSKGNLDDTIDERSARAQKRNLAKKRTEIHFSIFTENWNWDLKFVFPFDNVKEKRRKFKIPFNFKSKIECPFLPTDLYCPFRPTDLHCFQFNIQLKRFQRFEMFQKQSYFFFSQKFHQIISLPLILAP